MPLSGPEQWSAQTIERTAPVRADDNNAARVPPTGICWHRSARTKPAQELRISGAMIAGKINPRTRDRLSGGPNLAAAHPVCSPDGTPDPYESVGPVAPPSRPAPPRCILGYLSETPPPVKSAPPVSAPSGRLDSPASVLTGASPVEPTDSIPSADAPHMRCYD